MPFGRVYTLRYEQERETSKGSQRQVHIQRLQAALLWCIRCRQTDAIEFRDDCRNGKIEPKRINQLIQSYTDQPYKYLGKGNVRKNREEEQQ